MPVPAKMEAKPSIYHVPPGWLAQPGGDKLPGQQRPVGVLGLRHARGQRERQSPPEQNPFWCPLPKAQPLIWKSHSTVDSEWSRPLL